MQVTVLTGTYFLPLASETTGGVIPFSRETEKAAVTAAAMIFSAMVIQETK